eukprot:jgi/Chlat1/2071/Chrsp17S02771
MLHGEEPSASELAATTAPVGVPHLEAQCDSALAELSWRVESLKERWLFKRCTPILRAAVAARTALHYVDLPDGWALSRERLLCEDILKVARIVLEKLQADGQKSTVAKWLQKKHTEQTFAVLADKLDAIAQELWARFQGNADDQSHAWITPAKERKAASNVPLSAAHRFANVDEQQSCLRCIGTAVWGQVWWCMNSLCMQDLMSPAAPEPLLSSVGICKSASCLALDPVDGVHMWTGHDDGTVRLWNASTGVFLAARPQVADSGPASVAGSYGITCIAIVSSRLIWAGTAHGRIYTFEIEGNNAANSVGKRLRKTGAAVTPSHNSSDQRIHCDKVTSILALSDGRTVWSAGGSADRTLQVWNVAKQRLERRMDCSPSGPVVCMAQSKQHVLSGHESGRVRVWSVDKVEAVASLGQPGSRVRSVALHPSGDWAYAGHKDGTVRLWNLNSQSMLATTVAHSKGLRFLLPVGETHMLSVTKDGVARIWALRETLAGRDTSGQLHCVAALKLAQDFTGRHCAVLGPQWWNELNPYTKQAALATPRLPATPWSDSAANAPFGPLSTSARAYSTPQGSPHSYDQSRTQSANSTNTPESGSPSAPARSHMSDPAPATPPGRFELPAKPSSAFFATPRVTHQKTMSPPVERPASSAASPEPSTSRFVPPTPCNSQVTEPLTPISGAVVVSEDTCSTSMTSSYLTGGDTRPSQPSSWTSAARPPRVPHARSPDRPEGEGASAGSVQRQLDMDACASKKPHADVPLEDMIKALPVAVIEALSKHEGMTEQPKQPSRPREPWEIDYGDLKLTRNIGGGAYGQVHLASWRHTDVAVKKLGAAWGPDAGGHSLGAAFSAESVALFRKEVGIMCRMRHPNVVMFIGACIAPPDLCLVTEYCPRGSLYDVMARARAGSTSLDWARRLNMATDAALGMHYLHSSQPPVIHRDLKSPNILVDRHWHVKVCDFNLSRLMEASHIPASNNLHSPRWMAPEVLKGEKYNRAADVFSFGVILWELLTLEVPWGEFSNNWQIMHAVAEQQDRLTIPTTCEPAFRGLPAYSALIRACWARNPRARPTFDAIVAALKKIQDESGARRLGSGDRHRVRGLQQAEQQNRSRSPLRVMQPPDFAKAAAVALAKLESPKENTAGQENLKNIRALAAAKGYVRSPTPEPSRSNSKNHASL